MAEWINHPGKNTSNNSTTMVRQDVADGAALVTLVSRTQRGTTAQRDAYFTDGGAGTAGRDPQEGDTWANTDRRAVERYNGAIADWECFEPFSELAMKITTSGGYTYIGEAAINNGDYASRALHEAAAVWRAQRLDSNGSVEWADGNNLFDNVATDLTALSYS